MAMAALRPSHFIRHRVQRHAAKAAAHAGTEEEEATARSDVLGRSAGAPIFGRGNVGVGTGTRLCLSPLSTVRATTTTMMTLCAVPVDPCPVVVVWGGASGMGTVWGELMGAMGAGAVAGRETTGTALEHAAE